MNIITANVNKAIMDKLEIDVIKRVDGQFELRELLGKFVNLYFNKIILDISSLKNYEDVNTIINLSKAIDPSRIIILLDDNPTVNSKLYLSTLVKSGIYNFTRNYEGLTYLYEHPATYDDVKYLLLTEADEEKEKKAKEEERIANEIQPSHTKTLGERFVLGIQNLSDHAGATSLSAMLVQHLNNKGYSAIGFEMFKQDFLFFKDDTHFFSILSKLELETQLKKFPDVDCVVVDLNDFSEADKYCSAILYLVEPSNYMLTKLMKKNKNAFLDHKDEYVVLNKSFINEQEMGDFEYEAKVDIFANIPPVNDRDEDIEEIYDLLRKIGFKL